MEFTELCVLHHLEQALIAAHHGVCVDLAIIQGENQIPVPHAKLRGVADFDPAAVQSTSGKGETDRAGTFLHGAAFGIHHRDVLEEDIGEDHGLLLVDPATLLHSSADEHQVCGLSDLRKGEMHLHTQNIPGCQKAGEKDTPDQQNTRVAS